MFDENFMKYKFICVAILLFLAGCTATQNGETQLQQTTPMQAAPINTALAPIDFTSTLTRHKTKDYWVLNELTVPEIPYKLIEFETKGCVAIEFTITSKGTVQTPTVIYSFPEGTFDKAAINAIQQRRWTATNNNLLKRPVKTSTIFEIGGLDAQIRRHCQPRN
jgi:outer membrane biosynthesis protein TonB